MTSGGFHYTIISGRSRSAVNGEDRQDINEIFKLLRVMTSDDWTYLEEIEGRPSEVDFNELWALYERFGFDVKFNSNKDRASAILRLGKEEVIWEQFQRPGDSYVMVDFVTRAIIVIKENSSREQKVELMNCLFAVSAADDSMSSVEEGVIAQISRELGFTHREMIAIRSQYSHKRAVFQKDAGS